MVVPLFDRLLVKVPDEKKETENGIVLPSTISPDRPQTGTVIAKGEDVKKVAIGDEVIFRKYSPDVVEIGGEKHWLLSESDCIGIIK